ncbi:SDR family oxidoreductase [Xanthobacter aminoxidans]|uniref:SDR family oxidoreductase n=1 Tax=Xanthobacter aminoxidans TaxID=186280 RepID=UPI003728DB6F
MRIIVLGATGLIGSAVLARLASAGHEVVGLARNIETAARTLPKGRFVALDLGTATPEQLARELDGADAVVNAAGLLQDGPGESVARVHVSGMATLIAACRLAGVRRVVHISAIGVDTGASSDFSRTKQEGDALLAASGLDHVILRPSVVVGRRAYGGSAMFRGLAALPVFPLFPDTADLQIVQLDDVAEAVAVFVAPEAPAGVEMDLAGPERLSLEEVIATYRRWLGFAPARRIPVPGWIARLMYRLGDGIGRLGWRPPLRSTVAREIARGATGDPGPWMRMTGIRPQSLSDALAAEPAGVQERWFAALYTLKPAIFVLFALFWIVTALLSFGPAYDAGVALLKEGGAGALAAPLAIGGALADLAIGLGIAVRRTTRMALWAALAVSLLYVVAGAALLPRLWLDPLGPLVKIAPVVMLNLVALAILRDR